MTFSDIRGRLMWSRRSHTKSRNGCQQCKLRRIKCDEQPPQCSNCARRQIECDLTHRRPSPAFSASASTPSSATTSFNNPPTPSPSTLTAASTSSALDIPDLELLHHYTTVTYKTLPSGASSDQHALWQSQVVQLGFHHEFLLRGILSVSALHLLYLHPDRQESLSLRASTHQSLALSSVQEALNTVDTSNCVALFAFSCIIVVLAFATPRTLDSDPSTTNGSINKDILDWFHMIRGCNSVVQAQWPTLSTSFLAPLLHRGMRHETTASHSIPDSSKITSLHNLLLPSSTNPSVILPDAHRTACALAIHELLNTHTQISLLTSRGQDFIPEIFVWPIAIPDGFLGLLRERQPQAMVIFAYYAALLHRVDGLWFMRGWARYLIEHIDELLGEEWTSWLAWPKSCAGLD
ncbi:hypothetical protein ASPWEDRAFT_311930 [Aspergillus wentii DTO 134E9]|uniref:Zn(2)-C6 fungal-type domain-containing protein n=1 Tax=Aspergillus wentii DTO 134E9 TaxID=1073089 RepID=A0A1L9RT93_ASPWE|nr:uncharacterized protein ASPWEDRAFT_311930 [Aspergillus wentii DTO 134E9]KAI9933810.1 hypothetical protein MW887_004882 [Aspergillus wentii]OJJ38152.1 hypothetical protein ASPWEDRAFT_311930 [Aspergillus wentii DTO 134E9]